MSDKTGKCMCGAVSFTARNVPAEFGGCYCDMCRRWAGSRFNGVHVAHDDLQLSGRDHVQVVKSSDWAERAFCNKCGSALWYHLTEGPYANGVSLSVGLFDDPSGMTLKREYYVDRKTCLHQLPENRVQMTEAEVITMFVPADKGE